MYAAYCISMKANAPVEGETLARGLLAGGTNTPPMKFLRITQPWASTEEDRVSLLATVDAYWDGGRIGAEPACAGWLPKKDATVVAVAEAIGIKRTVFVQICVLLYFTTSSQLAPPRGASLHHCTIVWRMRTHE